MAMEYKLSSSELYHKGIYYENFEKNINLAIKYYEMATLKGHAKSMHKLGVYHQKLGKSKLVEYYYLNAINSGHKESIYNLAWYYYDIQNNELWMEYLSMSIENNDERAIYFMGMYYQYVKIDYDLMKKYYNMLITEESINEELNKTKLTQYQIKILYNLGIYYFQIESNIEKMIKYCSLASNYDDIKSIYFLGKYYLDLEPNIENYNQMKKYFNKILELNEKKKSYKEPDMNKYLPIVLFILGWYYMTVEINIKLGKYYYLMAHYKGNIHSTYNLGLYFLFVEKDIIQAKVLFHMIINELDNSDKSLDNTVDSLDDSLECFGFSKKKILSETLFILGWIYHNIETNNTSAIHYYSMAIEQGNERALYNLKLIK